MTVPIPPAGTLSAGATVVETAHGFDVTIAIRTLKKEDFRNEADCLAFAWVHLTQIMQEGGIDVLSAIKTMPRGILRRRP